MIGGKPLPKRTIEELAELQELAGDGETSVSLDEVKVLDLIHATDASSVSRSVLLGQRVAQEYQTLGMDSAAARVLRRLAGGACLHLGRYREAGELLDRSQTLDPDLPLSAAQSMISLRMFLAAEAKDRSLVVRLDPEFRSLMRVELVPMANSAYWLAKLLLASLDQNRPQADYAYHRCLEGFSDPARTTAYEAYLRSKVLIALSIIGIEPAANIEAERVRELHSLDPLDTSIAVLTFEARLGDPSQALDRIDSLRNDPVFATERTWQLDIEALIARARRGESVDGATYQKIVGDAARHGMADRAEASIPPEYFQESSEEEEEDRIEIVLFGGCSIRSQGTSLDLPEGLPLQLIKLLAVQGTAISVDTIIDSFWPETDLSIGKRRLKNVLSRARSLLGVNSIRRTADYLNLGSSVRVDLAEFYDLVGRIGPENSEEHQMAFAAQALEIVGGPLLATDQFVGWAESPRWQAEVVIRELIDQLLSQPGSRPAAWILRTILRTRLEEEDILVSLARFALLEGSTEVARQALSKARRMAAESGGTLDVPTDLEVVDR